MTFVSHFRRTPLAVQAIPVRRQPTQHQQAELITALADECFVISDELRAEAMRLLKANKNRPDWLDRTGQEGKQFFGTDGRRRTSDAPSDGPRMRPAVPPSGRQV